MAKTPLSLRIDESMVETLDAIAKALERSRSWVISDAIRRYIETEGKDIEAILEGIADVDAGNVTSHEEVMRQLDELLSHRTAAVE